MIRCYYLAKMGNHQRFGRALGSTNRSAGMSPDGLVVVFGGLQCKLGRFLEEGGLTAAVWDSFLQKKLQKKAGPMLVAARRDLLVLGHGPAFAFRGSPKIEILEAVWRQLAAAGWHVRPGR